MLLETQQRQGDAPSPAGKMLSVHFPGSALLRNRTVSPRSCVERKIALLLPSAQLCHAYATCAGSLFLAACAGGAGSAPVLGERCLQACARLRETRCTDVG